MRKRVYNKNKSSKGCPLYHKKMKGQGNIQKSDNNNKKKRNKGYRVNYTIIFFLYCFFIVIFSSWKPFSKGYERERKLVLKKTLSQKKVGGFSFFFFSLSKGYEKRRRFLLNPFSLFQEFSSFFLLDCFFKFFLNLFSLFCYIPYKSYLQKVLTPVKSPFTPFIHKPNR